jgi:hypothetical protein
VSLGPGGLVQVITLDIDLPDTPALCIAQEETIVDMKFADRGKVFDCVNRILLDLEFVQ